MQPEQITIKKVYSPDGGFQHLELCQGNNVITVSLGNTTLDNRPNNCKWSTLKQQIDAIQTYERAAANVTIG